jgi:uncharacterized protein YqhQ
MKKSNIGGEALIEGVMMRGPKSIAIAIRKPDGEIIVDKKPLNTLAMRCKIFKAPIIRGMAGLFESMTLGVKALMFSAEFVEMEDGESAKSSRFDEFIEKVFGNKLQNAITYFSVILALAMGIGLFILLPNLLSSLLGFDKGSAAGLIYYNLFEGLLRISLFFGYIVLISRLKDINRVFQYHGAEHKTIHCYEHEEELTVDNVRQYTTRHCRCGTAFLFIVMLVSILVFSFLGWHSIWMNILLRLLLLPLVAGISYEVLKFAGKSNWKIMNFVNMPGLMLQKFTTQEPDDRQIEVAIAALNGVLSDTRS